MLCGGRCGTRPWPTADRPGRRPWPRGRPAVRPWGISSRRSVSLSICRRRVTRASRPSISGSPCARRVLVYLREAEALAAALDDPRRLGRVSAFLANYFCLMGVPDQAIAAGQRALALATASGDIALQALAHYHLGFTYWLQGAYQRAIDCLQQTVASLDGERRRERCGLPVLPVATARAMLAICYAELGMFTEGIAYGEEG